MMPRRLLVVALPLSLALMLAVSTLAARPSAVPPAGFADAQLAPVGSPTALAFTPDGRLLIATQSGALRVYQSGALLPNAALNLGTALMASQTLGPGVYVCMGGRAFPAGQVRKDALTGQFVHTSRPVAPQPAGPSSPPPSTAPPA